MDVYGIPVNDSENDYSCKFEFKRQIIYIRCGEVASLSFFMFLIRFNLNLRSKLFPVSFPESNSIIASYQINCRLKLIKCLFKSGCKVREIGHSAFRHSGFESFRIEGIGERCFSGCIF
jgi:hypothetical protein